MTTLTTAPATCGALSRNHRKTRRTLPHIWLVGDNSALQFAGLRRRLAAHFARRFCGHGGFEIGEDLSQLCGPVTLAILGTVVAGLIALGVILGVTSGGSYADMKVDAGGGGLAHRSSPMAALLLA